MTLADILKPSLKILCHAEVKGLQIGAGLATVVCLPLLSLKPSLVNAADDPPLVAVAKCAGTGALAGAGVLAVTCTAKLCTLDKDAIIDRANRLYENKDQAELDRLAASSVMLGLGLAATRARAIADADGVSIWKVAATKESVWEFFCFSVLVGAAVVGGAAVTKIAIAKVKEVKDSVNVEPQTPSEEATAAIEQGVDDTTAAVEQSVTGAAEAVERGVEEKAEATGEKAADIVDTVKSSVVQSSE